MTEQFLGVFDNGKDSANRGTCNDCGASLRYEYLTSGGVYGSECVHAHIHKPDWMILKANSDYRKWAGIKRTLDALNSWSSTKMRFEYWKYSDGSVFIPYCDVFGWAIAFEMFIQSLIDSGWSSEFIYRGAQGKKYLLTRNEVPA